MIVPESVSSTPPAKIDSKKAEHTKKEKQRIGGKMNVSRGAGNRASSPSASKRPTSAVEEKEKKPV